MKNYRLVVLSVYAPSDSSPHKAKYECFSYMFRLLRSKHSSNVMFTADLETQVCCLTEVKQHIADPFPIPADLTNGGDRLVQVSSDHKLFLAKVSNLRNNR